MSNYKYCTYTLSDENWNVYECSYCKELWILSEGTPEENGMKYCPFCGCEILYN